MNAEKKIINILDNELGLSEDEIEVITFGYRLFVYSIFGYACIILLASLLGTLTATLTAAITASLFRIFSGGVHASSQKKCAVTGMIIFNLLGLLATVYYNTISWYWLKGFSGLTFIIALVSFILYAPADTPGKPISTKVQRNKLKSISIILLVIWLVFINFVLKGETNIYKLYLFASTIGLAWQSVSLWPSTYRWIIFK